MIRAFVSVAFALLLPGLASAAERGTCLKPAGEWNSEEVTVAGTKIKVVVNGKTIVDADITPFRDGQPTLDGKPHPGLSRSQGHIGFAGHHDEVHFRNIFIRPEK